MVARDPSAQIVSAMMLLGIKNVERGAAFHKWKGRLVALGNNLRDAEGKRVVDQLIHVVPVSLLGIRLLLAWEAL